MGSSSGKKRIMFIISSLSGGGAERVTANLCNALCEEYQVCLVTLFDHPDDYVLDSRIQRFDYRAKAKPKSVRMLRKVTGHLPRLLWLRAIKRRWQPQITISMLRLSNLLNVLCGREFRIVSERADPEQIGGWYYRSARFSLGHADHVVFQSQRVKHMFPDRVQQKSSIILNPVNVPQRASGGETKRIVTAGRLTEQKNHRLLVRAFGKFSETHPGYRLEIYGRGKLKEELSEAIREAGLTRSVMIMEFAPDLHGRIKDAEMFVLSSNFEGLSNALLEAMMMGLPCISTDCAGSDEIIENGVNGILTPVGDEDALAEAMCTLADDPVLRQAMSRAGRKASERFRTENVLRQWTELIEQHTEQNRRRSG